MTNTQKGKVAVITGSTKGIGYGIAKALAAEGYNTVIISRHQNDCDRVAREIEETYHVSASGIAADITNLDDIHRMVQSVIEKYQNIDVLINNAGSAITKKAEDLTEADWDRVLDLDLRAVFFCSQIIGRKMIEQKHGKIINISSALGIVAEKQVLPYLVAKAGVLHLTKGLAVEWAKYNIQVNAICPGYVITEINEKELSNEKIAAGLLQKFPMRRFGTVEEISGAAVFLSSDASNYMTGQHIVIDGGWTAQ